MEESRTNRKKGINLRNVFILIILFILLAGFLAYRYYEKSLEPMSVENTETIDIEIPSGSSTNKISQLLYDRELIASKLIFKFRLKKMGVAGKLKAGTHQLNQSMNLEEIINSLIRGGKSGDIVRFTVPEGYELNQIGEKLAREGLLDIDRFLELVKDKANFENDFTFLKDIEDGHTLEGYLFPSTYEIYQSSKEEEIIGKMLKEFEEVYNNLLKDKLEMLNFDLNQVVTLASIIEREGKLDEERPLISAVFHNRIDTGMNLQSCATVQYILGERKEVLSTADTKIPSPYNTYINEGLPPAPIASPGRVSLAAAIDPADVDYLFFRLTGEDGSHTFTRTYEEHQKASPNK